jgi:Zn-dependent M28 family amino/carboxypeptidase
MLNEHKKQGIKGFICAIVCAAFFSFPAEGNSVELTPYPKILWQHLETLCSFGPRNPGSPGHMETRQYIKQIGQKFADKVVEQSFSYQSTDNQMLTLHNIELTFEGQESGRPILLGAHYDTRPFADEDPDPKSRTKPIVGANDGGSGTAVLLALAQYLSENKPKKPIRIVFFDGEDFGHKRSGEYFLGSFHYAKQIKKSRKEKWPKFVLVVDMVGDKDLQIYKEANSLKSASSLVGLIHDVAKRKGTHQFINKSKFNIRDDHIPFIEMGIPSAVIIDFDYPHWHTLRDTLDKCSKESLFAAFSVVAGALDEI